MGLQENYPKNRIIRFPGYIRRLSKRLSKSLYSERWETLRRLLKESRQDAGLTQMEVAGRLERPQSLVAKIESGERKLDVCQFIDYLEMLGGDPVEAMRRLCGKDGLNGGSSGKSVND
ncbi:MAG: helix-turn-helix transcriptional regulator [Luteolibacter sp.]